MEEVEREPRSAQVEESADNGTRDHLVDEYESQEIFAASVVSLEYMLGEEVVQTLSESHIGEDTNE